jgi:arginyl-tRNA synthetase
MIKDQLEKVLGYGVEATENPEFGDYSSNVALSHKPPREYAEELVKKLKADPDLLKIVEKIEVAGPGFINFWLKKDVLLNNLIQIASEKEKYGTSDSGKGKTVIVEYSSPNIAKPFTIGHLRSTVIGDAVANLLQETGWKVMRDNHLGDWGTQFGKMIYAIKAWGDEEKITKSDNPVKDLVELYVKFHEEAERDDSLDEKARGWFKKLENGDTEARRIWQECINWSLVEFDRIYNVLGVAFSQEFEGGQGLGESFFESRMKSVIDELEKDKLLKIGEGGAKLVFFAKDKYPPAMILKKDGATLYHTRDLAADKYRLEKYNPDLIINEVGSEQSLYFQQLFEIEKLLGWFKDGQRVHVGHGLVRFREGKMSTRKGNVVWMDEVLEEARERAFNLGSKRQDTNWGDTFVETKSKKKGVPTRKMSEIMNISDVVAVGAMKYNDLKRDPKTDIVFDWDEILNMEGNSGPYLQYTIARTNSVLAKAQNKRMGEYANNLKLDNEELAILRSLSRFSEVIAGAAKNYSPNLLCNYLFDLASKYNSFYNKDKIIGSENEEFRLTLTAGTGQVLKNGLKLLGIEAPERM